MEEAGAVKEVIRTYEKASGQRINFEKTEITCSSNITREKRKELSDCLGSEQLTTIQNTWVCRLLLVSQKNRFLQVLWIE